MEIWTKSNWALADGSVQSEVVEEEGQREGTEKQVILSPELVTPIGQVENSHGGQNDRGLRKNGFSCFTRCTEMDQINVASLR